MRYKGISALDESPRWMISPLGDLESSRRAALLACRYVNDICMQIARVPRRARCMPCARSWGTGCFAHR